MHRLVLLVSVVLALGAFALAVAQDQPTETRDPVGEAGAACATPLASPGASPVGSPMGSPEASPVGSPVASPAAGTPCPDVGTPAAGDQAPVQ